MSDQSQEPKERNWRLIFLASALGVLVLWYGIGFIPKLVTSNPTEAGQYGDMFGMINSLFAGLAFAGLIVTMWMQKEELSLQRQEFREQRDVTNQSRAELERQADAAERTNRLTITNTISQGFMQIASIRTSQKNYIKIRESFIESLKKTDSVEFVSNEIKFDDERDHLLEECSAAVTFITIEWERMQQTTNRELPLLALGKISRHVANCLGYTLTWSSAFTAYLTDIEYLKEKSPHWGLAEQYDRVTSILNSFCSFALVVIESERYLDLQCIIQATRFVSKPESTKA